MTTATVSALALVACTVSMVALALGRRLWARLGLAAATILALMAWWPWLVREVVPYWRVLAFVTLVFGILLIAGCALVIALDERRKDRESLPGGGR